MNKPIRVAISPLTDTIYAGNVSKDGRTWLSNKTDVTGEACAAVAIHILARDGEITVTENGEPKYKICVTLLPEDILALELDGRVVTDRESEERL